MRKNTLLIAIVLIAALVSLRETRQTPLLIRWHSLRI